MKIRVGFGYDVHKLVEGRELWLGGIRIEHTMGLLGHSDASGWAVSGSSIRWAFWGIATPTC